MTDFAHKLHHILTASERQSQVKPSQVTRLLISCMSEQLKTLEKGFQKRLGKLGEKMREKWCGFAQQFKQSHENIMNSLEQAHSIVLIAEKQTQRSQAIYLAKMLQTKMSYQSHKTRIISKDYPISTSIVANDITIKEEIDLDSSNYNYTMKCHTADSNEPCTPENDLRLDTQIRNSLKNLFQSTEKMLANFQTDYGHMAQYSVCEIAKILRSEYSRAKQKIDSISPSLQEIRNIKQLETMVKATIQQQINLIRQVTHQGFQNR